MKEKEIRQVRTIQAATPMEFDDLYNETARELGTSIVDVKDLDALTARFYYTTIAREQETTGDGFELHGACAHCGDCPYLEVKADARRKTFPCAYSTYGETRIDCPACDVFYKDAIAKMREACKR